LKVLECVWQKAIVFKTAKNVASFGPCFIGRNLSISLAPFNFHKIGANWWRGQKVFQKYSVLSNYTNLLQVYVLANMYHFNVKFAVYSTDYRAVVPNLLW